MRGIYNVGYVIAMANAAHDRYQARQTLGSLAGHFVGTARTGRNTTEAGIANRTRAFHNRVARRRAAKGYA